MCERLVGLGFVTVLRVDDWPGFAPLRVHIETRLPRPVCMSCGATASSSHDRAGQSAGVIEDLANHLAAGLGISPQLRLMEGDLAGRRHEQGVDVTDRERYLASQRNERSPRGAISSMGSNSGCSSICR